MLEVQRPPMATHNADGPSSTRLRPVSVDSYHSSFSLDSYISSNSSISASSIYVHARSIYSVTDSHAETDESMGSSIDVQRPDTPPQDFDSPEFFVLCLFDYDSDDPDHMTFEKNDILKVIVKQPSGWWAAQVDDRVGWIPSAYVVTLAPDMLQKLEGVAHDIRVFYYEAEVLYNGAPLFDESPQNEEVYFGDDGVQVITDAFDLLSPGEFPGDVTPGPSRLELPSDFPFQRSSIPGVQIGSLYDRSHANPPRTPRTPRTPIPPTMPAPAPTPVIPRSQMQLRQPQPLLRLNTTPLMVNKPTPPTPVSPTPLSAFPAKSLSGHFPSPLPRSRSFGSSVSTGSSSASSSRRWQDILSPSSLKNSASFVGTLSSHGESSRETQSSGSSSRSSYIRDSDPARRGRNWRTNGDSDAQVSHITKAAQVPQPWYLKPEYTGDEIRVDHDGSVKAGTLAALVERLTVEPASERDTFRHTFFTTFHTFTTADVLLELLIDRYNMDPPANLTTEQFHEWLEKRFKPTQTSILNLFTVWVEQYGVVEDDVQVIPRLQEFLGIISASVLHAQSARHILQAIEQQRRAPNTSYLPSSSPARKASKRHKNDLLKIDYNDLARQLTLYEARLYLKVRPHECLTWVSNQKGDSVRNLRAFISTSDKLAAWVKLSVLSNDALGRRADTIDLWIRVAEKCRAYNNLSSMSSIVAALMSPVILKLQLTWAHVNRSSHLQPLAKLGEPVNNFGAYRSIYSSVDGPCIPYIGMYLNDMVKVDCITNTIDTKVDINMIDFAKRQKMGEVTNTILRHQPKIREQLKFPEIPSIFEYLETQLKLAASKDEGSFWMRSQEVQQAEIAHADIRRGLEAAGF